MPLTVGQLQGAHFDAVVIGSGFGGSVTAHRLAEAGQSVCVLERGKAYPPGSFARTPADLARNLWDPSAGLHGLFDVWSFRGLDAVTASGLGGGSLIYANVLVRKDERWFVQRHPYRPETWEPWPISRADLDPHYDRVERFLDVQTMPAGPADPPVPKYGAMAAAAGTVADAVWAPAPLAVRFRDRDGVPLPPGSPLPPDAYPSLHGPLGATRRTCRLCGECDLGCNDGAKNTLDHTYLSAAADAGAVISVRSQVVALRKVAEGFEVEYVVHEPSSEGHAVPTRSLPRQVVRARRVVLAAGAIGSTYLLLRNRQELGIATPALGTRYCGNGDVLGFLMDARTGGGEVRPLDGSRGPVITSMVRWPDEVDTGRPDDLGFYLEDAGYPAFMQWLVEATQVVGSSMRAARFGGRRLVEHVTGRRSTAMSQQLAELLGRGERSASSLPLLAMGRDVPDGRLHLRPGPGGATLLDSSWTTATSKPYYDHVYSKMAEMAAGVSGRLVKNPLSLLSRVVTVHSLGGCPMGTDPDQSVVDPFGAVHGVEGLHVADGAVFPGPIGPNPALSIAAFADRMCDHLLEATP